MSKLVVVSDIHGNYIGLEKALFEAGIINEKGNRINNKTFVLSMGDLANCVEDSLFKDMACLNTVGKWFDAMLMGNHEHPYFRGPAFSGFHFHHQIAQKLREFDDAGLLLPCYLKGETLVSHAGWDKSNHSLLGTPKEVYDYILYQKNDREWEHPIFTAIGHSRGGMYKHGGILWEDFKDLRSPFPQIVGHTSDIRIRYKKNAICIDTQKKTGMPVVMQVQ